MGCVESMAAGKADPAAIFEKDIRPLIQKHCVACHGPEKQKGKFRIDTLKAGLHEGESAGFWHEVLDQLNEGEMPPEDEPPLTATELATFTDWLETCLLYTSPSPRDKRQSRMPSSA